MLLAAAHRVDATQLILHYLTRFLFKYQCHGRTYTAPSEAGNHLLFGSRLTSAQALTAPSPGPVRRQEPCWFPYTAAPELVQTQIGLPRKNARATTCVRFTVPCLWMNLTTHEESQQPTPADAVSEVLRVEFSMDTTYRFRFLIYLAAFMLLMSVCFVYAEP